MRAWEVPVAGEGEMETLGQLLSAVFIDAGLVYLEGDLGSGKTTLVRGVLHGLGHEGTVKSPTFTLVESYFLGGKQIYHFDLYRLNDPEELEHIGAREYFDRNALCLVEWPDKGKGFLPPPVLNVMIHKVKQGRKVRIEITGDRAAEHGLDLAQKLENIDGVRCT